MHQPAIQAALDNLVEVIRTALSAEFLEFIRGEAPVRPKRGPKAKKGKQAARTPVKKRAKKAAKRAAK